MIQRSHGIIHGPKIMCVKIAQLFRIKPRWRAANGIKREPLDRLGAADNLIIAMAPAKAEQIIDHRVGKIALIAVGVDAKRAMAFREFGPINAMNQRDMGKFVWVIMAEP